jgi:DNA-binding MarR family transcriptional regulator
MASDPATITATVTRMEKNGLLKRTRHESDRRAKRVQLLSRGSEVFEQAHAIAEALQHSILQDFSSEERDRLLTLLELVAEGCARQCKNP